MITKRNHKMMFTELGNFALEAKHDIVFLPTLSQLLGLIEGEGFKKYTLEADGKGGYSILLWTWDDAAAEIDFGDGWIPLVDFHGQSREEAAAQAYLWILGQKVG